jgi:hypothetical protein
MRKVRFLKRIKIAKGVSLNLSKKGAGLSAGPKGLKISRSAQGRVSGSMGIPGSGLSYRTRLNPGQGSESEEISSDSFLMDISDKSAYIAKHGPIFVGKEMVRSLVYLFTSTLSLIAWLFTGILTNLGFLINPFLPAYILLIILYLKESKRNKLLMELRMEEHLKSCTHND